MATDTNFNKSPYFDDFDENKNFHRILFKPTLAVQARELTGNQTILQNQIERLGDSLYKNGTVIKDCAISFYPNLDFVRLEDNQVDTTILDITLLDDATLVSEATGLEAKVIAYNPGSITNYPATNRGYVRYLNSGKDISNNDVKVFRPNENLRVYSSKSGANSFIATVITHNNTAANTFSADYATGLSISDGQIYQKGFFIRNDEQFLVVGDTRNVGNVCVGFQTIEEIITADHDPSLLDNALGYSAERAPGADRLKLIPRLIVVDSDTIQNTDDFAILAQYVNGAPIIKNDETQYSTLGDAIARGDAEAHGSFVVKPFVADAVPHVNGNTDLISVSLSPGIAYAEGHRIETLKTAYVDVRKGTDVAAHSAQLLSTNYGSYVTVSELAGTFDFQTGQTVDIYDAPQRALTNKSFSTAVVTGTKIGTANIRAINYVNAEVAGSQAAQYEIYVYNIKMNSGKSFVTDAKSFHFNGTTKGIADIVLSPVSNTASVQSTERKSMLFSFGHNAIKTLKDSANNITTRYVVRARATSTIGVDGTAAVTIASSHAGGSDQLPYGIGIIGDNNESEFMVVSTAAASTGNITGTVTVANGSATITGAGTQFLNQFSVGEWIAIGGVIRQIKAIASATSMTADSNYTAAASAQQAQKYFPAGYVFPFRDTLVGTRSINVTTTTSFTVNIGSSVVGNLSSTIPVVIYHNILRTSAMPKKKVINRSVYVKINRGTHSAGMAGPYSLGLPDVYRIKNVYAGSGTFVTTNPVVTDSFLLDTGCNDVQYGVSSLRLKSGAAVAGNTLLVELDVFTANTSGGIGFFSIDSYPIDDANTANTAAIRLSEVPVYQTENGSTLSLRDVIDFRPYVTNTGNVAPTIAGATTNPSANSSGFNVFGSTLYTPAPDKTFEASIQKYVGRKDVVYFNTQGFLKVKEGVPSANPRTPDVQESGMPVVSIKIPPYPSLTSNDVVSLVTINKSATSAIRDTSVKVTHALMTNPRYTMRDIGVLDARITRQEYYTALNMLEVAATTMNVPDKDGLDRFKNGIFADTFKNHSIGDVTNVEYKIAIDSSLGVARPFITRDSIEFDYNAGLSSSVQKTGRLITLPYVSVPFIEQPYATKYRSAAPVQFAWTGHVKLFPNYDSFVDTNFVPGTSVTIDNSAAWEDFANSPFGTSWGDWRTTTSSQVLSETTDIINQDVSSAHTEQWLGGLWFNATDTTTTTTTSQTSTATETTTNSTRDGQKLSIGTSTSTYDLGTYVSDVSIQPFMRSRQIGFYGSGFRPSTRLHAFFDSINRDVNVAPGVRNVAVTDDTDDNFVSRTANWGAPISSDAKGELYGKFLIPEGIRTGERTFQLLDIDNLVTGSDARTTSGSATYVASSISVTKTSTSLTTINPEIQVNQVSEFLSSSSTTTSTSVNVTTDVSSTSNLKFDPLAQGIRILTGSNTDIPGVFATYIDLFFQKKATNSGITVYLVGSKNGYPNGTEVLPYGKVHLEASQVNVSGNGTVSTRFTFESPVFLAKDTMYAAIIMPDGGNPDYLVWMAELGSNDVATGAQVYSQPAASMAFMGANDLTWTALQTEYVKHTLGIAEFNTAAGEAVFENSPYDYIKTSGMTFANSAATILPGDRVYRATNTSPTTANASVTGVVDFWDKNRNRLDIKNTGSNFTGATVIQVHRPAIGSNTLNANTLVATASVTGIANIQMNALSPRFASIQPAGTKIYWGARTTGNNYVVESEYASIANEYETEFRQSERIVASRSNEIAEISGTKSLYARARLFSDSKFISPVIDTVRNSGVVIGNLIDKTTLDLTGEYGNAGPAQTKYVSKNITLASGQDAEDLNVYVTGYRPVSTEIAVYAKFLASDDPDNIGNKTWTRLDMDDPTIYSDFQRISDYREFKFTVPKTIPAGAPATTAIVDNDTSVAITYRDAGNAVYSTYKQFKIKIVLLSDDTSRVPILSDCFAICLQL